MVDETPIQQSNLQEDAQVTEGKLFAIIGYFGILCLVPLILKKENNFALFHGKQALVLLIGEVACAIVGIIPILGSIIGILGFVTFGLLSLAGILQALMGKFWRIPVVADVADKISL